MQIRKLSPARSKGRSIAIPIVMPLGGRGNWRARCSAVASDKGDRVATLAWNNYRHFEIEHGVTSMGAIWHAINPRLISGATHLHRQSRRGQGSVFREFVSALVEKLAPDLPTIELFVLMTDRAAMPAVSSIPNLWCYEDFIATGDDGFVWAGVR